MSQLIVNWSLQGEAQFDPLGETGSPVVVVAPPPIRVMPSLPRTEKPKNPARIVTEEEERFYARPTKIVPSIVKVKSVESPASQKLLRTSKPTNLVPRTSKPSVQPGNVKKPISAFKSVGPKAETEETKEAPIYIPRSVPINDKCHWFLLWRDPPTMSYKRRYKMAPSQGLNSLFREDTDHMDMKPPAKEWGQTGPVRVFVENYGHYTVLVRFC